MNIELNGRVWGYADEVDTFISMCRHLAQRVQSNDPTSNLRFIEGQTKVTGSRGFFNRRIITKTEYTFVLDNREQGEVIVKFLQEMSARMS